jgi:subtilase family serine protease
LLYTAHDSNVLTVTTHIVNAGVLAVSAPFSVSLRTGDPLTGTHLGMASVPSLEAGGRYTLTQAVSAATLLTASGDTLWAVADEGNSVAEIDESNNTATIALNILPDLTLTAHDIVGGEGLAVAIHNRGFITATDVLVLVGQGDQVPITPTLAYSETLSSIAPGEMGTVTMPFSPGDYTFFAKADPFNTIAELSEGNNLAVRTVTIKRKRLYLPLIQKQ